MNFIKKLSGSFLLGLTVIGLAFSASAFTQNKASKNKFAGEVYINYASGEYEQLLGTYDPNNCQDTSPNTCAWKRTDKTGTVPSNFNSTQAANLKAQGLIVEMDSKHGLYVQ
ncbi:hypothetical protein PZ892_16540 [Sphingobacterium sp. WM]|uniref:hypothetical protein n=1 Tax=Sphingobacterium sp. WM TaxID=3031802 RepID=UPI00240E391C|nr:hypothetical protein [Sphingobacterium sp. WM]WFB63268.1 hypothetical protein PZ892_16540 [Sphingobacterium sp. WM]